MSVDCLINYLTRASWSSESRFAVAMFWSDARLWNTDATVLADETASAESFGARKCCVVCRVRPACVARASVRLYNNNKKYTDGSILSKTRPKAV